MYEYDWAGYNARCLFYQHCHITLSSRIKHPNVVWHNQRSQCSGVEFMALFHKLAEGYHFDLILECDLSSWPGGGNILI